MQASPQVPCTLAKLSSLFDLLGTHMEGIRTSDISPRLDPIKQLSPRLNEMEHQMHDILAVIPLPKGPPSRVKGSPRRSSHKWHWETPSPPPKHCQVPRVVESSDNDKGTQLAMPFHSGVPSPTVTALVVPSRVAGTPAISTVAHLLTPTQSVSVEVGGPRGCVEFLTG